MNTQFDKVTKNRGVLPGYMLVKENGQDRKVIVADILYVDHSNCYVKIHTEHAIIATCIKFSAVKSFLCAHDAFVSCNRKMVLNMNKIKKVEGLFF
ncbi:MAG: LytTR family transcriptional regulator DNA-binding domain-containing protein, partial [Anaerovorax sp.]